MIAQVHQVAGRYRHLLCIMDDEESHMLLTASVLENNEFFMKKGMVMKNLVRTVVVFTLATSISAFAASKKSDASKAANVDNAPTAVTAASPADQEINPAKSCVICQVQAEDSKEKAVRQQLINEQEKEWLKSLHNQ